MRAALFLVAASLAAGADERIPGILSRVSEEAEAFRHMAPRMLAQETLVQRALRPPPRFRPRVGESARQRPKPEYRTREVVSEYGFSSFQSAPNALHEFREVISVDGRRVSSQEEARRTLTRNVQTADDRRKHRMLRNFERHGLRGAVTDFGQLLLLFRRARLDDYTFELAGEDRIGAEAATILEFRQRGGAGSLTVFEPREAVRLPLEGQLWVRTSDSLPLRIVLRSLRQEGDVAHRHEATVDYTMTPHGVLAPASVVHRQHAGDDLVAENVFRYSSFRIFAADASITFEK